MIISSVARVKFIKNKVIFRYHTKGVSNQASSNSVREIKSYSFSISSTKMGSGTKFSGLQNGAIRGLQIGPDFRDHKSGKEGLKIGVALGISNRGENITNRGKEVSNRGRDYKSGQEGFQIGAGITNWYRTNGSLKIFTRAPIELYSLNIYKISTKNSNQNFLNTSLT